MLYGVILWLTAGAIGYLAVRIYQGDVNLIHDYHQSHVTDKAAYGKAFGKAMGVLAAALALSGIAGLIHMGVALALLAIGLVVGIVAIVRVQKKYNGGVFS